MSQTVWFFALGLFFTLAMVPLPMASPYFPEQEEIAHSEVPVKAQATLQYRFVSDPAIRQLELLQLDNMKFWRKVITMTQDSCIVNVAESRRVIGKLATANWNRLSNRQQRLFRSMLKRKFKVGEEEQIYVTPGKKEFYELEKTLPSIDRAIDVFVKERVNPWYAQAILLIESPGRLQHSTVGAYGPFQLMKGVAREYGLIVNDEVDEREDLEKAGSAAAGLIRNMCIPYARRMLDNLGISYQEHELWFRLLVLHIYHAGPGNVAPAVKLTQMEQGGMPLIQKLWQTQHGGFQNASQNYSQVALACLLELENMIQQNHETLQDKTIRLVPGDFQIRTYGVAFEKILAENTLQ